MADPRDREYAELIVEGCLGVQPGWQVIVGGNPRARPLLEEVCGAVARRGAYALLRVSFEGFLAQSLSWVADAPLELLSQPAPLSTHELETVDAVVFVSAPDNTRAAAGVETERIGALQAAYRPASRRIMNHDIPWVACQYPTPALAQEAGLSSEDFSDLLFGAVLLDWAAEGDRMRGIATHFDAASEVRIVGAGTDLRLSLEGRHDEGRCPRRQSSRRRVLRVPARGLGRRRDLVRRLPGRLSGARADRDPAAVRRRQGRRCLRRLERGLPDRDARHRCRRLGDSASSASGATRVSPAT